MRNLLPLVFFILKTVSSSQDCCDHLYLHASGKVAEWQQLLLGIYDYEGISEWGSPYFAKIVSYYDGTGYVSNPFYFVYVANDTTYMDAPEGWRISSDINGSVPYVVTNSSETFPECPEGLTDGFVTTQDGTLHHDQTFRVECHSEEVMDNCQDCKVMEVTAENLIAVGHQYLLGNYTRKGQKNGHPIYFKGQKNSNLSNVLYFRKDGLFDDGWAIDNKLDYDYQSTYAIVTQVLEPCPTQINRGFIVQYDQLGNPEYQPDDTLKMTCVDHQDADQTARLTKNTSTKQTVEVQPSKFNTSPSLHAYFVVGFIYPVIMTFLM